MRRVIIETAMVGQSFGCCGVIRDATTRRKLATTETVGYGFDSAAQRLAEALANDRGWTVVDVGPE